MFGEAYSTGIIQNELAKGHSDDMKEGENTECKQIKK